MTNDNRSQSKRQAWFEMFSHLDRNGVLELTLKMHEASDIRINELIDLVEAHERFARQHQELEHATHKSMETALSLVRIARAGITKQQRSAPLVTLETMLAEHVAAPLSPLMEFKPEMRPVPIGED